LTNRFLDVGFCKVDALSPCDRFASARMLLVAEVP
jgi:hypothetical protein